MYKDIWRVSSILYSPEGMANLKTASSLRSRSGPAAGNADHDRQGSSGCFLHYVIRSLTYMYTCTHMCIYIYVCVCIVASIYVYKTYSKCIISSYIM